MYDYSMIIYRLHRIKIFECMFFILKLDIELACPFDHVQQAKIFKVQLANNSGESRSAWSGIELYPRKRLARVAAAKFPVLSRPIAAIGCASPFLLPHV